MCGTPATAVGCVAAAAAGVLRLLPGEGLYMGLGLGCSTSLLTKSSAVHSGGDAEAGHEPGEWFVQEQGARCLEQTAGEHIRYATY